MLLEYCTLHGKGTEKSGRLRQLSPSACRSSTTRRRQRDVLDVRAGLYLFADRTHSQDSIGLLQRSVVPLRSFPTSTRGGWELLLSIVTTYKYLAPCRFHMGVERGRRKIADEKTRAMKISRSTGMLTGIEPSFQFLRQRRSKLRWVFYPAPVGWVSRGFGNNVVIRRRSTRRFCVWPDECSVSQS